jgi:hypothetical protein
LSVEITGCWLITTVVKVENHPQFSSSFIVYCLGIINPEVDPIENSDCPIFFYHPWQDK